MAEAKGRIDWAQARARLDALGRRLANPESDVPRVLARRAERYASVPREAVDVVDEYVVFQRGNLRFGLQLTELTSIRRDLPVSKVPGAHGVVVGVGQVEGRIVSIHDLALLWGRTEAVAPRPWVLVGAGRAERVGLLADDVEGIVTWSHAQWLPAPAMAGGAQRRLVGVTAEGVALLDIHALLKDERFYLA